LSKKPVHSSWWRLHLGAEDKIHEPNKEKLGHLNMQWRGKNQGQLEPLFHQQTKAAILNSSGFIVAFSRIWSSGSVRKIIEPPSRMITQ
jgi:hypothetical protein